MRLTVVSWPATSNRLHVAMISSSVSWSPDSTTWIRPDIRSSPGSSATLRDQVREVFVEPQLGLHLAVQVVRSLAGERDERVKRSGRQRRSRAELVLVLHRHAEQTADHRHRQRMCQIGDDVEVTVLLDRVEQPVTSAVISGSSVFTTLGANALLPAFAAACGPADQGTGSSGRRIRRRRAPAALSTARRRLLSVARRRRVAQHVVAVLVATRTPSD